MVETSSPLETSRSPETIGFTEGLVGLQVRLQLQGEALNPNNRNVSAINREQLGDPNNRPENFFTVFSRASTLERAQQSQHNYNGWATETTAVFRNEAHRPKLEKLSRLKTITEAGVNFNNFTESDAKNIYSRYFRTKELEKVEVTLENGTKQAIPSNIKRFVDDVLSSYRNASGNLNYEALRQDLSEIQWLAKIFGKQSAEIITQLIDAEARVITQPEVVMRDANTPSAPDKKIRLDELTDGEISHLKFLYEARNSVRAVVNELKDEPGTQPERLSSRGQWRYKHLEGTRTYPNKVEIISSIINPQAVAQNLKLKYPEEFRNRGEGQLVEEIIAESRELQDFMRKIGLGENDFSHAVFGALDNYDDFLESTYGIQTPLIDSVPIIPIWGQTAHLYDPKGYVIGFVTHGSPAIFINMEVIEGALHREKREVGPMTISEVSAIVRQLLNETNIHEYTHLMSEQSVWQMVDHDNVEFPARLGIMFQKPADIIDRDGRQIIRTEERGRELMEGVTEELTREWIVKKEGSVKTVSYVGECAVLHAMIDKLRRENPTLSEKQAFQLFVDAYFKRDKYFSHSDPLVKLVETIENRNGVNEQRRPHSLEIIYALMGQESKITEKHNEDHPKALQFPGYNLTLAYIRGQLTDSQKSQILGLISNRLSIAAQKALSQELRIELPEQKPKAKRPTDTQDTPAFTDESMRKRRLDAFTTFFKDVPGEPDRINKPIINDYFIENPPSAITLTPTQLRSLELPVIYFSTTERPGFILPNKKVAPFVWDFLMEKTAPSYQRRFEDLTLKDDDDSSLRALAGTIAPTPEKQAEVYSLLIDSILKVHENNPDLIKKWFAEQFKDQGGFRSADAFMDYDLARPKREERLFYDYPVDNIPKESITPQYLAEAWEPRLKSLRSSFNLGGMREYHHRRIEMLAHSVDVRALVQLIRQQSAATLPKAA